MAEGYDPPKKYMCITEDWVVDATKDLQNQIKELKKEIEYIKENYKELSYSGGDGG